MTEPVPELVLELEDERFSLRLAFDLVAPIWDGPEWDLECRASIRSRGFSAEIVTESTSVDLRSLRDMVAATLSPEGEVQTYSIDLGVCATLRLQLPPPRANRRWIAYEIAAWDFRDQIAPPMLAGEAWVSRDVLENFHQRLIEAVRFLERCE